MAYQPKSYKKFVATAATATLVASAIAPVASADVKTSFTDVSDRYKEAVDYLVSNNLSKGLTETRYGVDEQIKRGDAAIILAQALGLMDADAPASGFTDVPTRAALAINNLKAAGIVNGKSATKFGFEDPLKRGEVALMMANAKAYNLKGNTADVKFTDVSSRYLEAVAGFVEAGITQGKTPTRFGTDDAIKRGEFAIFVHRADTLAAAVTAVSAANAKALTVTGTGLDKLKAEDITVEGNKVLSVTPAAGGKSATVVLETPLVDGEEYKVSVKVGDQTKEFTVKFTFVLADVAVTTTTLEANKDKQFLQVTLNGAVTDLAAIDSLGYDIEFQADEAVFEDAGAASTTSATGEIREEAVQINDTFNVKAVLTKDGKTAESKTVEVTVVSKATPAIGELVIETSELELTKPVVSTRDSGVVVSGVESNTGDVIDVSGLNSFASSNPEVATINASTGAIVPIKAGQTTISVKAGNVSYSKVITVVAEERKAAKATASTVNVAPGATFTASVAVTDQFGEKVDVSDITAANIDVSERTGNAGAVADHANATDGKLPVTITPTAAGAYTVVVKDLTTLNNLGQFTVRVSTDNTADNYKLEVADTSKGVINLAGTGTLTLNAKEFTRSGAYLQTLDAADTDFTVESANPTVASVDPVTPIAADGKIVITGQRVGSTQILLKKNGVQVATATVTVKEEVPTIESITWKSNGSTITVAGKKVNYKDIFNITATAAGVDEIVEGVKLNVNTTSKVRFDTTALGSVANPVLYLDQNDDGVYVAADDEVLGTLATTLSGAAGENIGLGSDWTDNILAAPTAVGDKGTVVITVTDNDTNSTVRASSTLNVNVR